MAGKTVDRQLGPVTFEDVRIAFRNFAGKEGQYNREGDRNFVVFLDPDLAARMKEDGWNVKQLRPRDEEEEGQDYLPVAVNFNGPRPPLLVLITSRGRNTLPEDMCAILDWVEIANVDMIVNPYQWAVNGNTGVKAYLKSIYITIQEDELERKYADVPDSAQSALEATATPLAIGMGRSDDEDDIFPGQLEDD